MSLVNCKTCGGKVSQNADACPHCGEPSFVPPPAQELVICPFCRSDVYKYRGYCKFCYRNWIETVEDYYVGYIVCPHCNGKGITPKKYGVSGSHAILGKSWESGGDKCCQCEGTGRTHRYQTYEIHHLEGGRTRHCFYRDYGPKTRDRLIREGRL